MSQTKPYPLPITGVDVLSSETALAKGAVRSAVNVDIGRAGRFKRRAGYTRRMATPGMHSLYYAAQKGWTLVARDAELFQLNTSTYGLTSLAALNSADKLAYTEYNGNLYFTNKTTIGWVPSDSTMARPVGHGRHGACHEESRERERRDPVPEGAGPSWGRCCTRGRCRAG